MAVSEKELRSVCDIGRYCNNVTVLTRKKKKNLNSQQRLRGQARIGVAWAGEGRTCLMATTAWSRRGK